MAGHLTRPRQIDDQAYCNVAADAGTAPGSLASAIDVELPPDLGERLSDDDECQEASVKPADGEFGGKGHNYEGDVTACGVAPQKVATEIGDQGLSAKLSRLRPCPTKESDVLSIPLNEFLTKAGSCMLQMGLTFGVCNSNSATSSSPLAASGANLRSSIEMA